MTHTPATQTAEQHGPAVAARLSRLDRMLPVWIGAAMVTGLLLGRALPHLNTWLNKVAIHGTSLPIAVGLLLMMYPVLAKVRYNEIGRITADRRMMAASLILNWVIGPAVMFALAWALLPDQPAYRTGVILVGLARCIAMVLIWTDLADGDREMAAVLVALNAIFQVLAYAALGVFYLNVLPRWLGLSTESLSVSMATIASTVAIFLGIPLLAGYLTRTLGERAHGQAWYEQHVLPKIGPIALYGLLFTVVILFALQGKKITSEPLDVARIALPLLAYFAVMWFGGFAIGRRLRLSYRRTAALAFSAASNDFELAIAVAIGVFGVTSGQALAGVVGPLIEVPVLLALVYVALWARRRFYPDSAEADRKEPAMQTLDRLEALFAFHGHRCWASTVGVRAGLAALEALGVETSGGKSLHASVDIGEHHGAMCFADGVQVTTGCTLGKGNITKSGKGKLALTLIDTATDRQVRVAYKPTLQPQIRASAFMQKRTAGVPATEIPEAEQWELVHLIWDAAEADVLTIGPVEPAHWRPVEEIVRFAICPQCGELVAEPYLRVANGEQVCLDCAGYAM